MGKAKRKRMSEAEKIENKRRQNTIVMISKKKTLFVQVATKRDTRM